MKIKGKVLKLGDNINTDFIISGRYKFSITDIKELSKHLMEDIDPAFYSKITRGKTILVAGKNFGMGSSREQAPLVIKEAGIIAVVAKSFARIFYRNSFNIGLPLIEIDTKKIHKKDALLIDLGRGLLTNSSSGLTLKIKPFPLIIQGLLKEVGVVNYYKKHKGFPL